MNCVKYLCSLTAAVAALAATTIVAHAQEASPSPAPAATSTPTFMDREYDGNLHVMVAPYIWLPTIKTNYQYTIPTLRGRLRGTVQGSVSVPASDYISHLNSAAMFAFDARQGYFDVFGDYIYTNASASAGASAILSGPLGRFQLPVSLSTNSHLRTSIWEIAGGVTIARGHDADLSAFLGYRDFPLNLAFDYTAMVGLPRRVLTQTGSVTTGAVAQDVIFGLRGRAFFGDGHWFVPYYADVGTGAGQLGNTTWEAYTGFGYAFNHGQTIVAAWRSLNYDNFSPVSDVQKLVFGGPLLGYTFNL
jgi:hypothetical protein